jgi:hypothetical protein
MLETKIKGIEGYGLGDHIKMTLEKKFFLYY